MLRSSVFVFVAGWITWFWLDKPHAGPFSIPPPAESTTENFQRAFDILKAGNPELAFIYIWNAHYLILSLLGGALVAVMISSVSDHIARRRLRKVMVPEKKDGREPHAEPNEKPGEAQGKQDS